MDRVASIVAALLEAEDFDPRTYMLDPDAQTTEVLNDIKGKLQQWFDVVEVYPAVEGTANFAQFFKQGNRYRIRCRRTQPVPLPRDWRTAKDFRYDIKRSVEASMDKFDYLLYHIEFHGDSFRNLLILMDMWPRGTNWAVS